MQILYKFIFGCWLLVAAFALPTTVSGQTAITVDINTVVSDVSNDPVGVGVNYLNDSDIEHPNRPRTLESTLSEMGAGTMRFPLGTLGENYRWHTPTLVNGEYDYSSAVNGLEPRLWTLTKNPSTNLANPNSFRGIWNGQVRPDGTFESDMDFDEFVSISQSVGAEPVVMVPIEAYLIEPGITYEQVKQSAVEWVRYSNITRGYGVTYWEIGNETDLVGLLTADEYATLFLDFAAAMKAVDPTIKVGANGFGFNRNWYATVLTRASTEIDFVIPHTYLNSIVDYENYRTNDFDYLGLLAPVPGLIEEFADPSVKDDITIIPTEISSFSPSNKWKDDVNDLYKSMAFFEMIGNAISIDKVEYLNHWITRNPFGNQRQTDYANSVDDVTNEITPMGRPIQIWNQFLNDKMVQAPRVAGFIRSYASYTPATQDLSIFLVNKNNVAESVTVDLPGYSGAATNEKWVYTGDRPDDRSPTWEACGSASLQNGSFTLLLEPYSVTVVAFGSSGGTGSAASPTAPTDLIAGQELENTILLTWSDSTMGARRYVIERQIGNEAFEIVGTVAAGDTSFRDQIDTSEATLNYRVYALGCGGVSTAATTTLFYTDRVSGLRLIPLCSQYPDYELRWRIRNPNNFAVPVNYCLLGTDQSDSLLIPPGDYDLFTEVEGFWNFLAITWTDSRDRKRGRIRYSFRFQCDLPVPADPTRLEATSLASSSILLRWDDNADNEEVYKLERRGAAEEDFTLVATLPANTDSYTDEGLTANRSFVYRLRAFNAFGHSRYSNIDSATTLQRIAVLTNLQGDFDLQAAGNADGANVNKGTPGSNDRQYWIIEDAEDGFVRLRNEKTGFVLAAVSTANEANAIQTTTDSSDLQLWTLNQLSDGTYRIVNKASGRLLEGNGFFNGANVRLFNNNSFTRQKWIVRDLNEIRYVRLSNKQGDFLLNATGTGDGDNVNKTTDNGSDFQTWRIAYAGLGALNLQNLGSELFLTAAGSNNGANAFQSTANNAPAQRWRQVKVGSEFEFENVLSGKLLEGNGFFSGANVRVWPRNFFSRQRWQATEVDPPRRAVAPAAAATTPPPAAMTALPTATTPTPTAAEVSIYPNPATTETRIEASLPIVRVTVTDLLGRTLQVHRQEYAPTTLLRLPTANLRSGTYPLIIELEGGETLVRRIVRQ